MIASEHCADAFYDSQYGSTIAPECKSEQAMIHPPQQSMESAAPILPSSDWMPSSSGVAPVSGDFFYTNTLNTMYTFPTPIPPRKKANSSSHPRHHSANGILQQYSNHVPNHAHQYHHRQSSTSPSMVSASSISTSPSSNSLSSASKDNVEKSCQHRCHIILQASTAVNQRTSDSTTLTYLNRGQAYGIQFQDRQPQPDTLITSTISITFHDASHRQAAHNYWRFWLSQQDHPNEARALDLDTQQSSGLVQVHYPSFDEISIQWQSQVGATIYVRFNCLSTDFSRIKGVKGIPLRAYVESTFPSPVAAPLMEKSYCKVKLFRDKGAERKNKDDAKQISKQIEKLKAEGNNTQHNPLWQLVNRPALPYTTFELIPEDDNHVKEEYPAHPPPSAASSTEITLPVQGLATDPYCASSSTAMFVHSPFLEDSMAFSSLYSPGLPSTVYHPSHSLVAPSPSGIVAAQTTPFPAWSSETPLARTGMKRSRSHMVQRSSSQSSSLADEMPVKKHARKSGLTLFINTKKNVSDLTCVELEQPTVQQLISKLSGILHLQANSVSEVLWRRNLASSTATNVIHHLHLSPAKKSSLILVEDSVIEYFPNQTIMSVEWEISASGLVRLILEF